MNFNPSRNRSNMLKYRDRRVEINVKSHWSIHLSSVVGAPSFDKTNSDCAHSGKAINSFKAMIHRFGQFTCKTLKIDHYDNG